MQIENYKLVKPSKILIEKEYSPQSCDYYINLNDNEQLSIAIPFFTTKIKEIALYYRKQREAVDSNLHIIKRKGAINGLDRYIKEQLRNLFTGDDIDDNLQIPTDLNKFLIDLNVDVEQVYDTFNDYYDLDPSKSPEFYDTEPDTDRFKYFTK